MELPRIWTALSSDVVKSSSGGYPRHADLGHAAENVVSAAILPCPFTGSWARSNRGDGELTLAPADVPIAWLLTEFINRIRVGVLAYNRNKHPEHRLRLRIGIDYGDLKVDHDGIPRGGDAIVNSARLRDCGAAQEATVAVPTAPVVVVVSDGLYQRAVPYGELGLEPHMFRRVRADVPGKNFGAIGWLHVPGYPPPQVTRALEDTDPSPGTGDDADPTPGTRGDTDPALGTRDDTDPAPGTGGPSPAGGPGRRVSIREVNGQVFNDRARITIHGGMHFGKGSS